MKSHLAKVAISRDDVSQPKLPHDRAAGAIGERQVLVAEPDEQLARALKAIAVDPLPSHT